MAKRKIRHTVPTLDDFHDKLRVLVKDKNKKFTKNAVTGLREVYFSYLNQVAAELAQHDEINDDILTEACGRGDPKFQNWTKQAQELLKNKSPSISTKRPKRRKTVTADMEAAQELLFKKSREAVLQTKKEE